ncbi:MAG: glutaminyl-peptide cyclotransferase [Flavipsychrobacter sp.]
MRQYRIYILPLLLLAAACGSDPKPTESTNTPKEDTNPIPAPKHISYQLVNQYPHSPYAYTEGLQFVDGYLYEGTGQFGTSILTKNELETGKVLQQHKLENKYFGEGITVMGDKIYQLTYQAKTGFVYDKKTFKLLKTFSFDSKEGWGMTNDSTHIIYGDGTDQLYFLDPETLQKVKTIKVVDRYGPVSFINELEYIKGYIYANQWQTELILKIDPATGYVVGRADLKTLRQRTGIPAVSNNERAPEVLNGIAYDSKENRIFVTGKNWPKLFEIKLDN